MAAPLYQLPNGDWITLEDVYQVSVDEWNKCLVRALGDHESYERTFATRTDAIAFRDELAQIVNTARSGEQPAVDRAVPAGEFP